mgnify:CR=1 FL=1
MFPLLKLFLQHISFSKLPLLPLSKQQSFVYLSRVNIFDKAYETKPELSFACLNSIVIEGMIFNAACKVTSAKFRRETKQSAG